MLVKAILLFILGLVLLIKGGDWFVDGATGVAEKFKIPEILIGATVVSIGTTLPEVMVSASAALGGSGSFAYGNAIGSIICNTALISALTIAIKPTKVDRKPMIVPLIFFFIATAIYCVVAYGTKTFTRGIGLVMLLMFVVYIGLTIKQAMSSKNSELEDDTDEKKEEKPLWKDIILIVLGATLIAFGADLLVDNGTIIAKEFGVPETVIALTFVALGTSLPELVTAITSLLKGHGALSLGNIIGANLFNLILVSGISVTLAPFDLPVSKMIFGMNASLVVELPVMILVMAIMSVPTLITGKLSRWQGILLLCIYAGFCVFQFV